VEVRGHRIGSSAALVGVAVVAAACGVANPAAPWLSQLERPYISQHTFGGDSSEVGNALVEAADGGFLLVGYTESYGSGGVDLWLVRTGATGDTLWTRTYGGPADDHGWDVASVADGGFVVAGFTASRGAGGEDVWLLRLDEDGDTLWTRTYGGGGDERAWALAEAGEGWVIAAQTRPEGTQNVDLFVVRVDSRGRAEWTRTHGGAGIDRAFDVEATRDGGFVVAGVTADGASADQDGWLVRLDGDGRVAWERSFGGDGNDVGRGLELTPDGGMLMVGYSDSDGPTGAASATSGANRIWLVRTDANGREQWSRRLGESRDDRAMMGTRLAAGGYAIAGYASTGSGDWNAYVVGVDEEGQQLWSKQFGGQGSDRGLMVTEKRDGSELVLVGAYGVVNDAAPDVLLVRFRGEGN